MASGGEEEEEGLAPGAVDSSVEFCDIYFVREEHNDTFQVVEMLFRIDFGVRNPDNGQLEYFNLREDVCMYFTTHCIGTQMFFF